MGEGFGKDAAGQDLAGSRTRAAPPSLAPQDLPRDNQPRDLRGALVDLGELRAAHQLLHRVVLHVPVAAESLHGVGGDPHGHIGGEAHDVGGDERVALPPVEEPGALKDQQPGRRELGRAKAARSASSPGLLGAPVPPRKRGSIGEWVVPGPSGAKDSVPERRSPAEARRGLDAANEAAELVYGGVHLDIVLVDARDGRIQVVDFGLSKVLRPSSSASRAHGPADAPARLLVGPREPCGDKLALCAALYEVLAEVHRPEGVTAKSIASAAAGGEARPWPEGSKQRSSWTRSQSRVRSISACSSRFSRRRSMRCSHSPSQLAAGFRFVGNGSGSTLPQCFAEERLGSHEPGAHVEDHSLDVPKALVFGLGRQDHVLAFLQRLRRWE
jgi:hypothetical protein